MANNTIRTLLAIDGEKEFRQKIQRCNSELATMRANMKTLTAEYETNGKSIKSLKGQKQLLQEQIAKLTTKTSTLDKAILNSNKAIEKATEEYNKAVIAKGKDSDEAKRLEGIIEKLRIKQNQYKTQLANTNTELVQTRDRLRQVNDEIAKKSGKLSDLIGKVVKFNGELAKLELKGLKASLEAVTKEIELGVKGLGAYAAAVTAAAGAIGGFAVKAGIDFEEGMSGVEAISGATAEQMEMLTQKAKDLGSQTKFTAKEASDAFNYMAMAGWEAEDMMSGIDGVINLAAASGEELGLVSDIVTDSLTAFKMEAGEAGKYADILAQASSNANTNVAMMGETFQYCAPIAGAMGYKADDLAVAIGLMANAGIKGSMAGTSLRSVITNLAAPTDAAEAAMDKLGIKITDDEDKMKPFSEVVEELKKGFDGLSEAEAAAAAKAIAGKPGMSGLLAIINASEDDYNDLRDAIDNCSGAAERMAKIKLDNLKGDVTLLKSATDGLGTTIFDNLNPGLRQATQFITMLVNKVQDGIKFGRDASGVIRDVFANIKVMAERGIKKLIDNMPAFLAGFNTVVLSLADLILQLMPQITTTLLPALITGFADLLSGLVERFPEMLSVVMEAVKTILHGLIYEANIIEVGFTLLDELVNGIVDNLPEIVRTGMDALMQFINGIVDRLPELLSTAIDIVLMVVDGIIDNLEPLIKASIQIILALCTALVDNIDKILPYIPTIINAVIDGIVDNLGLLIEAAMAIILALGSAIVSLISEIDTFVLQVCNHIKQKFIDTDWKQLGIDILTGILAGIGTFGAKAKNLLTGAINNIKNAFTGSDGFDIHSPSKWAKNKVGKNIALGQLEGIEETAAAESKRMFSALSSFGKLVTSSANDLVPAAAGGVTVNLNGDITLNNSDGDLDSLITDIETRIYERQLGRGR